MCNWVLDLQDIISIIGTGGVLIIGWAGLKTWKKQLKGKTEYELSRRILVGLFAYKDLIKNVRNPMIFSHETPAPPDDEKENMSKEQQNYYGIRKAYEERWNKLMEERKKLYLDHLEAEALWGNDVNRFFKVLYELHHELANNVRHYLVSINPDANQADKTAIKKIKAKKRDIFYDVSDYSLDKEDEFQTEISEAIDNFTKYLKTHLKD